MTRTVFTNIPKNPYHSYYRNENRYRVFEAHSETELEEIIAKVYAAGYKVYKIGDGLGNVIKYF